MVGVQVEQRRVWWGQITTFALDREAVALTDRLRSAIGSAARVHAAGNMYWPGWTEITVSHQAAEKGAAVSALLEACSRRRGYCLRRSSK